MFFSYIIEMKNSKKKWKRKKERDEDGSMFKIELRVEI